MIVFCVSEENWQNSFGGIDCVVLLWRNDPLWCGLRMCLLGGRKFCVNFCYFLRVTVLCNDASYDIFPQLLLLCSSTVSAGRQHFLHFSNFFKTVSPVFQGFFFFEIRILCLVNCGNWIKIFVIVKNLLRNMKISCKIKPLENFLKTEVYTFFTK